MHSNAYFLILEFVVNYGLYLCMMYVSISWVHLFMLITDLMYHIFSLHLNPTTIEFCHEKATVVERHRPEACAGILKNQNFLG